MSGITDIGSIFVAAGPHECETASGVIHVDRPISRQMADVVVAAIEAEGLTTDEVMAVEFRGEGRPIITSINEHHARRLADEYRREAIK